MKYYILPVIKKRKSFKRLMVIYKLYILSCTCICYWLTCCTKAIFVTLGHVSLKLDKAAGRQSCISVSASFWRKEK
jgi:hypothetical protein